MNALNFPGALDWSRVADWGQSALRPSALTVAVRQGPGQKANGHRKAGPGLDWPALPELGRRTRNAESNPFASRVLPVNLVMQT